MTATCRIAALLSVCAFGATTAEPLPSSLPAADDARLSALITDERLAEMSGLAASRIHPDILWTHNDSGDGATLHAISGTGNLRASVTLEGVHNIDFEDIAGFDIDGQPHLLIADTGDNGGIRRELQLYVIREPADLADSSVEVAWRIDFRWPDGARDCEAVAVDAQRGEVLLVSKKRVPPELFRLPLRPTSTDLQIAEAIASLPGIAQPTSEDLARNPIFGRYRSQISGLDISRDGRSMAVLNYLQAYVYRRGAEQSWADAVAHAPRPVKFTWLAQAEAIAFDADGNSLWIGTERLPAPLLRIAVPAAVAD